MRASLQPLQRIGVRLSLVIAAIMLVGVGLVGVVILRNEALHLERYTEERLADMEVELRQKAEFASAVLAAGGTEALLTYNYTVLDSYARSLAGDADVVEVVYRDANRRFVAGYSLGKEAKAGGVVTAEKEIRAESYRAGSVSVAVGLQRLAAAAGEMRDVADERKREALALLGFIAVILAAGVMGGVIFAVNSMVTRPLNDMVQHMAAAPEGVIMDPPEARRRDEIGHLVRTYNDMSLPAATYKRDLLQKVDELEASWADLRALIESLEQRVADRTRALEETNEEIRSFAYIVSHDLRAPLVSIKGFAAELALSLRELWELLPTAGSDARAPRLAALMAEDIPEALSFIETSVGRMDRLINAVLALSRAGRRELRPEQIDMNGLVALLLGSLAHQREGRRVIVPDLPPVTADRLAMEQIMGNLLDNAFKYLDPDRPGVVELSAEELPGEIVFHIRDNGRGISRDDLPRVFEMFRRAGRQDVPGDGMGLAYVKALVKRHDGRIWCESEPGAGSTFSVALPRPVGRSV